jgi:hypothetical protein
MIIKTIQEQNDDLKRHETINYLIEKGFKNLNFKENLLRGEEVLRLSEVEINDAIKVFLESLNIASGSNTNYDFYSLLLNYIQDSKVRDNINAILK